MLGALLTSVLFVPLLIEGFSCGVMVMRNYVRFVLFGISLLVILQMAVAQEAAVQQPVVLGDAGVPAKAMPVGSKGKSMKLQYMGPSAVIVMPVTPMLDGEGKQRLDPDGQPMFNPPLKQQRDKKGHPLFDDKGKPVFQTATDLGYDEHGKKLHASKVKEPKMTLVSISRGTFTVDGMIAKAELNYNIPDFKYMYLYAPGVGTLVVSNDPFPGAKEQKNAFDNTTLTVSVGDHRLQIASDKQILGKKSESAFVLVDRDFNPQSKYPVVGYGSVLKAPYTWPGSRPNNELAGSFVKPPPIPINLQPTLLLSPCPVGQMRKPADVLPGHVKPEQPCVAVPKGVLLSLGSTTDVSAAPATTP